MYINYSFILKLFNSAVSWAGSMCQLKREGSHDCD